MTLVAKRPFVAAEGFYRGTNDATTRRLVSTNNVPYAATLHGPASDHEAWFGPFRAEDYPGSEDIVFALRVGSADGETTGVMHWGLTIARGHGAQALSAMDLDATETKATVAPDATAGAPVDLSITVLGANTDGLASGDTFYVRGRRVAGAADTGNADTMPGDAFFELGDFTYDDGV